MKKIYVTDPDEAVNLPRENIYSGFDSVFFSPNGQLRNYIDPGLLDSNQSAFLAEYSTEHDDLEFLCCIVIQTKKSPAIVGMIAERHPKVGASLLSMMLRQREILAECLKTKCGGAGASADEKDVYTPYFTACLSAAARVQAHKLLMEFE